MNGWYRCIFVIIVVWNDVTCSGEYVPKCELSHDEVYYRPTFSTQIHPRLNRWSCVFFFLSPCSLLSFYVSDSYRSVLIRSLNKHSVRRSLAYYSGLSRIVSKPLMLNSCILYLVLLLRFFSLFTQNSF